MSLHFTDDLGDGRMECVVISLKVYSSGERPYVGRRAFVTNGPVAYGGQPSRHRRRFVPRHDWWAMSFEERRRLAWEEQRMMRLVNRRNANRASHRRRYRRRSNQR